MWENTSCMVMNKSFGPAMAAPSPPSAKAAGITARPAISATSVSQATMTREFLVMLSLLER